MAVTAIPTSSAKCGTTTDTNVGLNPNTNANDKVQAFADAFSSAASTASSNCHNLPGKLILGLWGGESGWATGNTQKNNQNWANMKQIYLLEYDTHIFQQAFTRNLADIYSADFDLPLIHIIKSRDQLA